MTCLFNKILIKPASHFFILIVLIQFLFLLSSQSLSAKDRDHFELTPTLRAQYKAILSLDWQRVDSLSQVVHAFDENNALVYLFDNYSIITQLLIDDREAAFEEVAHLKQEFLQVVKKADRESPFYRYARAEILLQWSIINYQYGNRFEAFTDVWTAYDLLEDNIKAHPDFISSYRSLGLLHAFLGTLPISDGMKWLLERTSGMSGSIEQGLGEISQVLDYYESHPDYIFGEECKALYAYLVLHLENKPEKAWELIQNLSIDPESPMGAFARANLALKTGRLLECIDMVNQVPKNKLDLLPILYFIKGRSEMYLQLPECRGTFRTFLSQHTGETYRYAAYQKIAWTYLLDGDQDGYRLWMDQCLPEIELRIGEDKDAHAQAKAHVIPNKYLLNARLKFDSGQFDAALGVMKYHPELAETPSTQLEYYYRYGRIYQAMKRTDSAIKNLERAYDLGREENELHACNAALQIGIIYEETRQTEEALNWFARCLDLRPDVYRKSLHHKAKAGIKRIEG